MDTKFIKFLTIIDVGLDTRYLQVFNEVLNCSVVSVFCRHSVAFAGSTAIKMNCFAL